jgi:hypothetical protein
VAPRKACGVANLIVDQHTGNFGSFDVPVRADDGALSARTLRLTAARGGVPMVDHPCFSPPDDLPGLAAAIPSVAAGVGRILKAVSAHREQPNAARQMAAALDDLMSPWVAPMPGVGSSDLMGTSLASALLEAMAGDPGRCAESYNAAVRSVPSRWKPSSCHCGVWGPTAAASTPTIATCDAALSRRAGVWPGRAGCCRVRFC